MVKRFKTAEGKRMKVKISLDELSQLRIYRLCLLGGGLMIALLLWGAIS